jgi:hypothetical protein
VTIKNNPKLRNAWRNLNQTWYTYDLHFGKEHFGDKIPLAPPGAEMERGDM